MLDDLADMAKKIIPGSADDKIIDAVHDAAEKVDVDEVAEQVKKVIPGAKEDVVVDKIADLLGGDGETGK